MAAILNKKILYAVLAVVIAAAAFLILRPGPPLHTLERFVRTLHNRDCKAAYRFVSEEWKSNDPEIAEYDGFKQNYCVETESSFAKIFVNPLETKTTITGSRAEIDYFICTLPQGLIRRSCVRQNAKLTKQGIRWKISSFAVRMDTPHEFNYEKPEGLISPNSSIKHPVRQRPIRSEKKKSARAEK